MTSPLGASPPAHVAAGLFNVLNRAFRYHGPSGADAKRLHSKCSQSLTDISARTEPDDSRCDSLTSTGQRTEAAPRHTKQSETISQQVSGRIVSGAVIFVWRPLWAASTRL